MLVYIKDVDVGRQNCFNKNNNNNNTKKIVYKDKMLCSADMFLSQKHTLVHRAV